MIYFTSDLHLCHDRDFVYEPRGFTNIYDMNEAILENWNKTIQPTDEVYILGDLMLNDNDSGRRLLNQMNGTKHIILGNHDTATRVEIYKNDCRGVADINVASLFKYGKYHFYLSHYATLTANLDVDKPLNRRLISLCGHVHTPNRFLDMDKGLIYHVEMDAHNCTPVSIEEIISDIENYAKENF